MPKARILVTANSNSACDEIGDRLLNYVGTNQVYRFYSASFDIDATSEKLVRLSNLRYKKHNQPSYEEIYSCNVVLATLVNSSKLSSFPSDHFDFIFIDECASGAEAFVNIPISLVVPKFSALIVFLGDHKQLGQIMTCYQNEK
jgi:superfamily I DNA and/or RNA helicase